MPVHSQPDLHTRSKKDYNEINLQQGSGDLNNDKTDNLKAQNLTELLQQSKPLQNNDDPLEFNERKRKNMEPEIHKSFLHPSFVKTSKISVSVPIKKNKKSISLETETKKETITPNPKTKIFKHKFKFS